MKKLLLTALVAWSFLAGNAQQIPFHHTIAVGPNDSRETIIAKAAHVVPTPNQLRAMGEEFIAFIHIGPNTFTRLEWGNGFEDPKIFDLKELDTDQWCAAMSEAGIKLVILTAKHHDGFVLWPSRYTNHGISSTGFQNGKGDVVKELSASCQKYGLKLGIYLSPADLYHIERPEGLYGNRSKPTMRTIPRAVEGRPFANKTTFRFKVDDYNEYFLNQLFELLTEYGPVHEVWFDGAHPKTKGGQTYNYAAWKELIHTLAPEAVVFGREDIRWCGNESGATRDTEWNVVPYAADPNTTARFPDMMAQDIGSIDQLLGAKYLHYQQAETNTSIREGWFYRDDTHQRVRSADDVFDIYERSVGGNSTFLLNIPPNREGKFSPQDVEVLRQVGERIRETYGVDLLAQAGIKQRVENDTSITLMLDKPVTINRVVIQEVIGTHGERVEQHAVDAWIDGQWQEIASATNIGYKRILRFADVATDRLRLRLIATRLTPNIATISAHHYRARPPQLIVARQADGKVAIAPAPEQFRWKPHGENTVKNLNTGIELYYTTDGTTPDVKTAHHYTTPFDLERGEVQAVAVLGDQRGAIATQTIGYAKTGWKVSTSPKEIVVDLNQNSPLTGFAYTPLGGKSEVMTVGGTLETSNDGTTWSKATDFEFGNLTNDPTERRHYFAQPITTRFLRFTPRTSGITINHLTIY